MVNKKRLALSIILLFALFMTSNMKTQNIDNNDSRTKSTEVVRSILDSLKGRWAGYITSDSTGKITIGMNISVRGDSIFGNSTIQWPSKVSTQIFKGRFDKSSNSFTLFEPQDDKKAGVYQYKIKYENNRISIVGTWTRNRDNRQYNCEMDKVGNLTFAIQNPVDIIKQLISNIDNYTQKRDDDFLKLVYNTWLSPEIRIGDFDNFKQGFSTTLSDRVLSVSELPDLKNNINYTSNPQKLNEVEGVFSLVTVIHEAVEYVTEGDTIKLQHSIYQGDYKFIVSNGVWKILSGKAKLLKRHEPDTIYTALDLQKKYNINQLSSLLEITNVFPNPANENDTITINFVQNSADELQDIKVFFDKTEAKIIDDKVFGQLKCIVPAGMSNSNPELSLRTSNKTGVMYKSFNIKSLLPWYFKIPWYVVVLLILLIIGIIIYAKYRNDVLSREKEKLAEETQRLTLEKNQITTTISQLLDSEQQTIDLPTPKVPVELVDACKNGDCILFASSELPHQAGYPLWVDFIFNLINWSVENKYLTDEQRDLLISSIKSGRIEQAADSAITNLNDKGVDLTAYLSDIFTKQQYDIPEIYNYLNKILFSAAVSGTFDNLLERSYDNNHKTLTAGDGEQALAFLNNKDFFIFKVYGDLGKPGSILLAPSQFSDAVSQNYMFAQFIENVFNSRTVFCIGANIDAIEKFLKNVRFRGGNQRKHFALVGVKGTDWKTSADILEKRYGIEVLPYTAGNDSQILDFVKELSLLAPGNNEITRKRPNAPIKKVIIENIGPFENLELKLDEKWNILLGDNGVGKSSILKAIATGLIGKDAEPLVHRLIKKGKNNSRIIIETDNATYTTNIYLKVNKAELNEHPRPLDSEGWLAIAFPPLRTITWKPAENSPDGSKIPLCEDILPIITGEPDPRMDKLKEWIMKLYTKSLSLQKQNNVEDNKYSRLISKFFEIVDNLTPNLIVKFSKVDPISNEVMIITEDGEIPIEAISQGTLSLISWLGILIQRLYEVYGDTEEDPTKRYALVIMDEIDAHMHPEWQHSLVYSLKSVFPNIQFIVSTHSPLVVGGMLPSQLFRFTRNEYGKVIRINVDEEDTLGRTDQLLTSKLFGLNTTLDKITQNDMNRYEVLLGKSKRTPEEQKEFIELEARLEFRIPPTFENSGSRKAQKLTEKNLDEQISKIDETDIAEIKNKINKLTGK